METITVYWSPVVNSQDSQNMLYRDPTPVLQDLLNIRNKEKDGSLFACPAASAIFNNLFVVKSNLEDTTSDNIALLQFGEQSGGIIINGDIYTWGNNKNRINVFL